MLEVNAAVIVVNLIGAYCGGVTWFGWELGEEPGFDQIDSIAANAIASMGTSLRVFRL